MEIGQLLQVRPPLITYGTSSDIDIIGYVKYSFTRAIHFGRMYTNGAGGKKGNEADLCEALRCLGQGLQFV